MSDKALAGAVRAAHATQPYISHRTTLNRAALVIQRDSGLLELLEAAEKYHKDAGHVAGCDVQWHADKPKGGPCNCSARKVRAAIEKVRTP